MELNDLYDYGLKIYQNSNYFKFSLDSILLGEMIKLKPNSRILDLCTGNGPVPLILTTKRADIKIDALEIQREIFELGKKSIDVNNLNGVINILNEDARTYNSKEKYDIILANPPYFKVTYTSQKNKNNIKMLARHEVTLTLADVIEAAKRNLKENGTFFMVHRVERYLETLEILKNNKMGIRKTIFVYTKDGKQAEFFLIESSNYKRSDLKVYSINVQSLTTYKNIFKEW